MVLRTRSKKPLTWDERAPFLDTHGRERVHRRTLACAASIEAAFKLPRGSVRASKRLGCGFYGCAYMLPNQPVERSILKATTDPLEANAAAFLASFKKRQPKGLAAITAVVRLGMCSVLPNARDRRPLYAIWREEVADAWPVLRGHGVKLQNFKIVLLALSRYLENNSLSMSFESYRDKSIEFMLAPERDELVRMLARVGGEALLEACEWLIEHDMFAIDVIKPANIGWRKGTGLVLRDIGATEAGFDVRSKIERVGGRSGSVSAK